MRRMRAFAAISVLSTLILFSPKAPAQDYVYATGYPNFGINYPVPGGSINVSNGDMRISIPLGSFKQRGRLSPVSINLEYDSKIWRIIDNNGLSWQPVNVPNSMAGWRLTTGLEQGTVTNFEVDQVSTETASCAVHRRIMQDFNESWATFAGFQWTDALGTGHTFNVETSEPIEVCDGDNSHTVPNSGGYATDGSGYYVAVSNYTQMTIYDNTGNEVYPVHSDSNGNVVSIDSNGTVTDSMGRTLLTTTISGSTIQYHVLKEGGGTNTFTVNTVPLNVSTDFQEPGVSEFNGSLTAVQSVGLPDGSAYSFVYDSTHYGEVLNMTLPTGGVVSLAYLNYLDSYSNENRWVFHETENGNTTTFAPQVLSTCSSGTTGCEESVTVRKPNGDSTVYTLILNNGAWNSIAQTFQGTTQMRTISNYFDFTSYSCGDPLICVGAMYITGTKTVDSLVGAGNATTLYSYNAPWTGEVSSKQEFDYNASGTPSRETDYTYGTNLNGANLLTRIAVQSSGNPISQTVFGYGSGGNVTSETKGLSGGPQATMSYSYDGNGMLASATDPNGNATSYQYLCNDGYFSQTTSPQTSGVSHIVSANPDCNNGAPLSATDQNGQVTTYSYDTIGRLSSITYPDGGNTSYGYPSANEIDTIILATPNPSVSSQDIVDSYGRPSQHIQAGVSSETSYDVNGRVNCVSNPHFVGSSSASDGSVCMTQYDGLDRPLVETEQDGSTLTWSYTGKETTSVDEAGNSWQRTVDALGRLTNVVEPNGAATSYTYDALNHLLTVTQNGVSGETPRAGRTFVYDSLSRLSSKTDPETGMVSYSYLNGGALCSGDVSLPCSETDARGVTISYSYDALNRLALKTSAGATGVPSLYHVYQYDQGAAGGNSIGRLNWTTNSVNSDIHFSYDPMGRVSHQTGYSLSDTSGLGNAVSAQYDLAGHMISLTYPDGRVVKQAWDGGSNLTAVTYNSWNGQNIGYPYLSSATYWPNGSPKTMIFGNGDTQTYSLNSRLQPVEISVQAGAANSNQVYWDKRYCYGLPTANCPSLGVGKNNGNIWQVTDPLNANRTQGFSYDSLNRLAGFSNGDASMQQAFAIDSFGNMSQSGTLSSSLSFGANNQINASGYGYDSSGDLTSFNNGIFTTTYAYDANNQIANVNNGGVAYSYDPTGQRVRKDTGGSGTEYVYFGGLPLAERNGDGTWSDYIYSNGRMIARGDTFDQRIRIQGTTNALGYYAMWYLPFASYVVHSGDKIFWRQYQQGGSRGGVAIAFSDGSNTNWTTADSDGQVMNDDTSQNFWHERSVDLSSFAGKTASALWISADARTPVGTWNSYFSDMSIVGQDGTVVPIYTRESSIGLTYSTNGNISNPAGFVETDPGAIIYPQFETTYFHGDQLGSTRMMTAAEGWPVASHVFYPFGQEQNPSIDPTHYKFTGQDRDSESNLDYFNARHFNFALGRFMSPDPYSGSMDPSNPQSFNRYAYVGNMPLTFTDPSGMDGNACDLCTLGIQAGIQAIIHGIESLFVPSFHGTTTPRPNAQPWDEYHIHYGANIPGALGLPGAPGCEFGACGFQQGGTTSSVASYADDFGQLLLFSPRNRTTPLRLFGSRFCGPGGAGNPNSHVDGGCQVHDGCFDDHGINFWGNIVPGLWNSEQKKQAQICNQGLYNTVIKYPNEPGSKPIQNWLKYGDWFGILGWNTNVH